MLPFAVVPLLKFAGSERIMGPFVLPRWQIILSAIVSVMMFSMNFVMMFLQNTISSRLAIGSVVLFLVLYFSFVLILIAEPIRPLKPLGVSDRAEHDQVIVDVDVDKVDKGGSMEVD